MFSSVWTWFQMIQQEQNYETCTHGKHTHTQKIIILHPYLAKFKLFLRDQRPNLKNKIKYGDHEEKRWTNWSHNRERSRGRVREFPQKNIPTEFRVWNYTNPSITRSHQFQTPKNTKITSNFFNSDLQ